MHVLPQPPCMSQTTPAEKHVLPRPPCEQCDPERVLHICWLAGGRANAHAADRAGTAPQPAPAAEAAGLAGPPSQSGRIGRAARLPRAQERCAVSFFSGARAWKGQASASL